MTATETQTKTKLKVFSGIQPTGKKTLGNYSGGFRQYVQTQESGEGFFCIVDLHSISVEYDPAELRSSTLDLAAVLFAAGLDAERSTIFCQSHVTAHAEANWLLSSVASYGQLGRMTQFKEKAAAHEFVSAALFTYPVLMAGDILLYQTDVVPVGDDQRQHLELARDIAQRFNHRFGETFRVPEAIIPAIGGRIMDLQEPTSKMSTTLSSEQGAVYIADTPEQIRKKFKSAVTDSEREIRYDPPHKPGVSNLLEIMSVATGEPIDALERRFDGSGYGDLKEAVGESVVALLAPIRERFEAFRADERELQRLLAVGAEKARRASEPTLELMYDRLGFVRSEAGRFFGAARPRGL
jgi:tryptophanyl-tRNA synthetase